MLAEASVLPSGLKAASTTESVCPVSGAPSWRLAAAVRSAFRASNVGESRYASRLSRRDSWGSSLASIALRASNWDWAVWV